MKLHGFRGEEAYPMTLTEYLSTHEEGFEGLLLDPKTTLQDVSFRARQVASLAGLEPSRENKYTPLIWALTLDSL